MSLSKHYLFRISNSLKFFIQSDIYFGRSKCSLIGKLQTLDQQIFKAIRQNSMKGNTSLLKEFVQNIQKVQKVQNVKYEVTTSQMGIIIIDVNKNLKGISLISELFSEFEDTSIMMVRPVSSFNTNNEDISIIRRSSKIRRQVQITMPKMNQNSKSLSLNNLQSLYGLKNLREHFNNKKKIEIIKTGWPHGITIQISYIPKFSTWCISDGKSSCLIKQQNNSDQNNFKGNIKLKKIVEYWLKIIDSMNKCLIRQKLSKLTITGKIMKKNKQLLFFSAIENQTGIQYQPFEAREIIQKIGFKFVSIKSYGMYSCEEGFMKKIQKIIEQIQIQFIESKNYSFGRSKIYLAQNNGNLIGGEIISTSEDRIYKRMKQIIRDKNIIQRQQQFSKMLQKYIKYIPFPQHSYHQLFQNMNKLISILEINQKQINEEWYRLPKLCLYLLCKRLQIQKYGKIYYTNQSLDTIQQIPYQQFGPLQCKMSIIYYLVHPSNTFKHQLASKLKQQLQLINLSFSILDQKLNDLKQIENIIKKGQNNMHSYFLISLFNQNQLKIFQYLLNLSSKDHYYKIIYITQLFKGDTIINQNSYPFSWTTIVQSYRQALQDINKAQRSDEKIKILTKITNIIREFKNYEIFNFKNYINITLHHYNQQKSIKQLISSIMGRNQKDLYYRLISKLQKYQGPAFLNENQLDLQVTNILKKSFSSIKTISIKLQ